MRVLGRNQPHSLRAVTWAGTARLANRSLPVVFINSRTGREAGSQLESGLAAGGGGVHRRGVGAPAGYDLRLPGQASPLCPSPHLQSLSVPLASCITAAP